MILPKGIVVNTENVYDEIASHKQVPFDRVWQVWRGESVTTADRMGIPKINQKIPFFLAVYTITNRKLQDPTARRLENFWWHVMGSDRRLLSGELLAGLYEDISLGSTFIPLKGPSNRWDGDDVSNRGLESTSRNWSRLTPFPSRQYLLSKSFLSSRARKRNSSQEAGRHRSANHRTRT